MQHPTDYRAQAADCVRRAETAKNSNHRMILLRQAQTLLRLADEAEAINKTLLCSEDDLNKAS